MAALAVAFSPASRSRINIGGSSFAAGVRCMFNHIAASRRGQHDPGINLEQPSRHTSTDSAVTPGGHDTGTYTDFNTSSDADQLPDTVLNPSDIYHPGNSQTTKRTTIIKVVINHFVWFFRYLCLGYPSQYSTKASVVIGNIDASGLPLADFGRSWEDFLKSLSCSWNRSWNISIFLFSAPMTVAFYPGASIHPIPRICAILPISCGFVGLLTANFLLSHFDTHASQNVEQALRWLGAARDSDPMAVYNTWIVLAMPDVWATWGIICFMVLAVSFIWTMGKSTTSAHMDMVQSDLGMAIGAIFVLAIVEVGLVWRALKGFVWNFWRNCP